VPKVSSVTGTKS